MSIDAAKPIETFICYEASDKAYYEQLLVALAPLQQQGLLDIKHSREIGLQAPWRKQVHPGIYSARLILLLVSQNFISSGYDRGQEMQQALQRQKRGATRIVPILLRPTFWDTTPLRHLAFLLGKKKPISKWEDQRQAFEEITIKITSLINELQKFFSFNQVIDTPGTIPSSGKTLQDFHLQQTPTQINTSDKLRQASQGVEQSTIKPNNTVFICYSHEDSVWLKRLQIHLRPIERAGKLAVWDDTKIQAGTRWHEAIQQAIESAVAIILLISADFLASEFISTHELPRILARVKSEDTTILPLIVGPSLFMESELGEFQSVNSPEHPLIAMTPAEQEQTLTKLAKTISKLLLFSR